MSQRKVCSYKDCNSKHTNGAPSDITFFQFPRDPERAKLWEKLACCEKTDTGVVRHLCSKHFDERKYISKNPRRLLLLTNAIPYKYMPGGSDQNQDEIDEEEACQLEEEQLVTSQFDDEDYLMHSVDVSEFSDPECHEVTESTISEVEYVEKDPLYAHSYGNVHKKAKIVAESPQMKVFRPVKISTQKMNIVQQHVIVEKKHVAQPSESETQRDEVIDNPNITTFIFKGEEYIQMPKEIYLREKNDLVAKLEYYKNIVMNIKSQVNDVHKF